jgi:hypothetical protein
MNPICDAAQRIVGAGLSVVPCHPHSKLPAIHWHEYRMRLPHANEIMGWLYNREDRNLAVVTGSISSNLVILDLDMGLRDAAMWIKAHPAIWQTRKVQTQRGVHVWLRVKHLPKCELLADGVEVKAGGLCMVPPSIHPSGLPYRWIGEREILEFEQLEDIGVSGGCAPEPPDSRGKSGIMSEGATIERASGSIDNTVDGVETRRDEAFFSTRVLPPKAATHMNIPKIVRDVATRKQVIIDVKKELSPLDLLGFVLNDETEGRFLNLHCPKHDDRYASLGYDTVTRCCRCLSPYCILHNNNRWMDVIDVYRSLNGGDLWTALTVLGQKAGIL